MIKVTCEPIGSAYRSTTHEFCLGEAWPELPNTVVSVFATGAELEFIREHFNNIPMVKCEQVHWHGDLARFIANHIALIV